MQSTSQLRIITGRNNSASVPAAPTTVHAYHTVCHAFGRKPLTYKKAILVLHIVLLYNLHRDLRAGQTLFVPFSAC